MSGCVDLGQFCCIGKQICSAIHPLQNPDGGWVFHNLRILRLAGMQAGWCAQHCLSDADLSTLLFAPMEGCLEPSSVKYLASLMQGRQQPSGHFSWNQSLQTLVLKGVPTCYCYCVWLCNAVDHAHQNNRQEGPVSSVVLLRSILSKAG